MWHSKKKKKNLTYRACWCNSFLIFPPAHWSFHSNIFLEVYFLSPSKCWHFVEIETWIYPVLIFFFLWKFFFLFLWKMAWMIVTSKTSSLASFVNCGYLFPISWVFCTWLFFQHLTFSVFEKVPLLLRAGKEIISHYWEKLKPEAILEFRLSNGAWGFCGMPVSSITTLWNKNMYMDG